MSDKRKIMNGITAGRILSVCLMLFCLTFLTSVNYFLYSSGSQATTVNIGADDADNSETDYPPSGPTEEKSGGPAFSFSEEILHENHPELNFQASNYLYLHHIAEAEKIELFHPELILRPPKFQA